MTLKRDLYEGSNRILGAMPARLRRPLLAAVARLPMERMPPRFLAIEPTNHCNLSCPLCPVGAGTMVRRRGFMDLASFRNLVDEISPFTRHILMNFAGEPLLHPQIGAMIRHVVSRGMRLTLGTHGNIDKMAEIVEAGLPEILFSLDGTTEEVYSRYRVGGRLSAALANLEKLVVARGNAGVHSPRIILQFVVMKHNQHQIPDLLEIAARFGVDEISLQPVCVNDFFPQAQLDLMRDWVPADSPYVLHPGLFAGVPPRRPALCIWSLQSVILHNGDVTVCCFDADGAHVVGNAFAPGGFSAVWHSARYREARRRVITQELSLCRHCDISVVRPVRLVVPSHSA